MSKTIVITGASRGIGFALTQLALQEGHRIYALSRNIQPLKKSERLYPYRIDLSEEQSLPIFAEQLQKEGIKIDALIHNAGMLLFKPFSETTTADFESIYRVNVFGLAALTRLLLPSIEPKGHIV